MKAGLTRTTLMKLYKEPLVLSITSFLGIVVLVWMIVSPPKAPIPTVDHKTPIPLIIGDPKEQNIKTSETIDNAEPDDEETKQTTSPDNALLVDPITNVLGDN
mgnify:FL=1